MKIFATLLLSTSLINACSAPELEKVRKESDGKDAALILNVMMHNKTWEDVKIEIGKRLCLECSRWKVADLDILKPQQKKFYVVPVDEDYFRFIFTKESDILNRRNLHEKVEKKLFIVAYNRNHCSVCSDMRYDAHRVLHMTNPQEVDSRNGEINLTVQFDEDPHINFSYEWENPPKS